MASHHEIVAEEWKSRSRELAEWAMEKLANRKDVWGQYAALTEGEQKKLGRTYKAMTLPVASKRGPDMVTLDKLTRHFASQHRRRPQIVGLHAKSKENTSKWLGIDIDMHDDSKADAEEHSRRNLVGALKWWRELQSMGYDPLLFDSNNNGGYHLWVLFDEPAPTEHVFAFAWSLVSTWEATNLSEEPETFPKKPKERKPGEDVLGAWFRLPGLHHTRDHYARVWSGDEWLDDPWLSGHAAIDAMVQCVGGPAPPAVSAPEDHSRITIRGVAGKRGEKLKSVPHGSVHRVTEKAGSEKPKRASDRKRSFKRSGKATVCVDLDGVLAQNIGATSLAEIGDPVDGAVEFTRELSQIANVVILTSRLSQDEGKVASAEYRKAVVRIEDWLNEHGFAFERVHTGQGKPPASAYIDDRGVSCKPMDDGIAAFKEALEQTERLCN